MSRLGTFMVQEGLLSGSDRRLIRRESASHNGSFARSVLALGLIQEEELSMLLAARTAFRRAAKDILHEMDPEVSGVVPNHILAWLEVLPLAIKDGVLSLAMVDPTDIDASNQVRFFTGLRVKPVIATRSEILRGLRKIGAELPLEENQFESFIRKHARQPLSEVTAPSPSSSVQPELGIDLVQKSKSEPDQQTLKKTKTSPVVMNNVAESHSARPPGKLSDSSTDVAVSTKRLDLSLGLGALTDKEAPVVARPRSPHAELSVAVQAGMSILNRFAVKVQLTKSIEEALQKFLETVVKAGLTNGILARVQGQKVDFVVHWMDSGLDSVTGFSLPPEIDEGVLLTALQCKYQDNPWLSTEAAFGGQGSKVLDYWSKASAKPDSVFVVERQDGGLVCAVSFAGQYNHDGLRQIFADMLRNFNSRL